MGLAALRRAPALLAFDMPLGMSHKPLGFSSHTFFES